jgi:hypothetical protein
MSKSLVKQIKLTHTLALLLRTSAKCADYVPGINMIKIGPCTSRPDGGRLRLG